MLTEHAPRARVPGALARGEHPLPRPRRRGVRILAGERARERDPGMTRRAVAFVEPPATCDLLAERLPERCGQHRHPVLPALPPPHGELPAREVEVPRASSRAPSAT